MALGYLLLGAGFTLNAFAGSFGAFFVAMTIFTIGEMISAPVSQGYLALLAPESLRGRYMGGLELAHSAAVVVGPRLGAELFMAGPLALWGGCGLIGLLSAAVILWKPKPAPPRRASEEQAPRPTPAVVEA
jgi:MFS family permease